MTHRRLHIQLKGMALGPVLMVIAIALVVAFTLAGTSVFHIRMAAHTEADMAACNLAEAGLATVVEQCMKDPQYGNTSTPADTVLTPSPNASCIVTFRPGKAISEGMQVSVNNNPPQGTTGAGPVVVPGSPTFLEADSKLALGDILIGSKATVDGVTRTAYTVIEFPANPYAIAASGHITLTGSVVAGLKSGQTASQVQALMNGLLAGTTSMTAVGKGNVASNTTSDPGLTLTAGTTVTGNAEAVTGVVINSGARAYAPRPDSNPVVLPTVAAASLNPMNTTNMDAVPGAAYWTVHFHGGAAQPPPGAGAWYLKDVNAGTNQGDPDVTVDCPSATFTAPLVMNNEVIYTSGSIVASGGISGTGIVAAGGTLTVQGNTTLSTTDQLAVVADAGLTINGTTPDKTSFFGEVYTGGPLTADGLTLAGSYTGYGTATPSTVAVTNSVIVLQGLGALSFPVTQPAGNNSTSSWPVFVGPSGAAINWVMYNQGGQQLWGIAGSTGPYTDIDTFMQQVLNIAIADGYTSTSGGGAPSTNPYDSNWWKDPQYTLLDKSTNSQKPWSTFVAFEQSADAGNGPPPSGGTTGTGTGTGGHVMFDPNKFINPENNVHCLYWGLQQ